MKTSRSTEKLSSVCRGEWNFTKTYNIHKRALKGKKALLLGEIEALSRKKGYCYAKVTYLSDRLGICKKTLLNYYRELEDLKLLKRLKSGRRTYLTLGENFFGSEDTPPPPPPPPTPAVYTFSEANFTPMRVARSEDSIDDCSSFLEGEKKKGRGQTKDAPTLVFEGRAFQLSEIKEHFEQLLQKEGYELEDLEVQGELEKFLGYHGQGSRFSLRQNLLSWVEHDRQGPFFRAREKWKRQKVEKHRKRESAQQERQKEIEKQKDDEQFETYSPVLERFFALFHQGSEASLSELLDLAEECHPESLSCPNSPKDPEI